MILLVSFFLLCNSYTDCGLIRHKYNEIHADESDTEDYTKCGNELIWESQSDDFSLSTRQHSQPREELIRQFNDAESLQKEFQPSHLEVNKLRYVSTDADPSHIDQPSQPNGVTKVSKDEGQKNDVPPFVSQANQPEGIQSTKVSKDDGSKTEDSSHILHPSEPKRVPTTHFLNDPGLRKEMYGDQSSQYKKKMPTQIMEDLDSKKGPISYTVQPGQIKNVLSTHLSEDAGLEKEGSLLTLLSNQDNDEVVTNSLDSDDSNDESPRDSENVRIAANSKHHHNKKYSGYETDLHLEDFKTNEIGLKADKWGKSTFHPHTFKGTTLYCKMPTASQTQDQSTPSLRDMHLKPLMHATNNTSFSEDEKESTDYLKDITHSPDENMELRPMQSRMNYASNSKDSPEVTETLKYMLDYISTNRHLKPIMTGIKHLTHSEIGAQSQESFKNGNPSRVTNMHMKLIVPTTKGRADADTGDEVAEYMKYVTQLISNNVPLKDIPSSTTDNSHIEFEVESVESLGVAPSLLKNKYFKNNTPRTNNKIHSNATAEPVGNMQTSSNLKTPHSTFLKTNHPKSKTMNMHNKPGSKDDEGHEESPEVLYPEDEEESEESGKGASQKDEEDSEDQFQETYPEEEDETDESFKSTCPEDDEAGQSPKGTCPEDDNESDESTQGTRLGDNKESEDAPKGSHPENQEESDEAVTKMSSGDVTIVVTHLKPSTGIVKYPKVGSTASIKSVTMPKAIDLKHMKFTHGTGNRPKAGIETTKETNGYFPSTGTAFSKITHTKKKRPHHNHKIHNNPNEMDLVSHKSKLISSDLDLLKCDDKLCNKPPVATGTNPKSKKKTTAKPLECTVPMCCRKRLKHIWAIKEKKVDTTCPDVTTDSSYNMNNTTRACVSTTECKASESTSECIMDTEPCDINSTPTFRRRSALKKLSKLKIFPLH